MPTTAEIDRDDLIAILEEAGLGEDHLRERYSGRGMGENACFGVLGNPRDAFCFFAALGRSQYAQDAPEIGVDAVEMARSARIDQLGLQQIVYFPGYTLTGGDQQ